MTKNSTKSAPSMEKIDRPKLLDISSRLIKDIFFRVDTERFREHEGDSVKLQYLRVLVQAVQAHNAILKDIEIDEIKNRLDALEAAQHDKVTGKI